MGFWHTGYMDFHEEVGFGKNYVPQKQEYPCSLCEDTFHTTAELRQHRFECHPLQRPILLFQGLEVGNAPLNVVREVPCSDWQVLSCEEATVNGNSVNLPDLGSILARISNDNVVLILRNNCVESIYTLTFRIASESDLSGVDQCFEDLSRRGRLDIRSIEDFIQSSKKYRTAINYYTGICEYFYGVLVKERAVGTTLNYESYPEKYNQAVDKLNEFDRTLSNGICSLVHYHFNHFDESVKKAKNTSRVGGVSLRYEQWLSGVSRSESNISRASLSSALDSRLTDSQTEQLLQWGILSPYELHEKSKEIDSWISKDISPLDRSKLMILMAESFYSLGSTEKAKFYCREMINSSTLGLWANGLLKKLLDRENNYVNL